MVEGRQLSLQAGRVLEHRRLLDLRQGVLFREWRQQDPSGRITRLNYLRLASLADRHVIVQSMPYERRTMQGTSRSRAVLVGGMAASARRFDRQVLVDRPDRKGRLEILKVHVRKVQLERDIDLDTVAALTTGFTGADSSAAADRIMGKRRGRSVELSHSFLRNARAAMPTCVPADLRRARVCIAL